MVGLWKQRVRRLLLNYKTDDVLTYGNKAVPVLIEYLNDSNKDVRMNAAKCLGLLKDRSAVPALINALDDEFSKKEAIIALGLLRDERAVDALKIYANDYDPVIREKALNALKAMGVSVKPEKENSIIDDSDKKKKESRSSFSMYGVDDDNIPDAEEEQEIRVYDPDSFVDLNEAKSQEEEQKIFFKDTEEAISSLKEHFSDLDPDRRRMAIDAMSKLSETTSESIEIGIADNDPAVRIAASHALEKLSDTSMKQLIYALQSDDPQVREVAAEGIRKIGLSLQETKKKKNK